MRIASVAGAGQPVDRAVGVHDRREAGVADRGGERLGVDLAQLAGTELDRPVVPAALGQRVPEEVLAGRGDAVAEVGTLEAARRRPTPSVPHRTGSSP